MKEISSLIVFILAISSSIAQELKVKKERIDGINQILNSIGYELEKPHDFVINPELSFEFIDTTGRYILQDIIDGESDGYTFYNKKGEKLNEYHPYPFFEQFDHDVNSSSIVIAASTRLESNKLKIAWLDIDGKLLIEKEVDNDANYLRDIKVINNRLVVICHDSKHRFTITCYDQQLNTLWSSKIEEFIHYSGVKSITRNNSIIIFTKQQIMSIDLTNGKEIWTRRLTEFQPTVKHIAINGELIFEKHFLGVISYEPIYDEKGGLKKANNVNFNIFDILTGNILFHDTIDEPKDGPIVCKNPFNLDSNDVYIKSKDKGWRYSLIK